MVELLCVMAIISILAALLLGAVGRAYQRVRSFGNEMNSPAYVEQIRSRVIQYVSGHPTFPELSLKEFVERCQLSSPCAAFLRSAAVTYFPFASTDPDDQIVIVERVGTGREERLDAYPKGWLCKPDPP